jgi:hypothetical protein
VLVGLEVAESWLEAREAERSLMNTTQLSEEEILAVSRPA